MAVGSSKTIHSGCIAITPAMATRCFCPPDNLFGECSLYFNMPTAFKLSSTRCQISSVGTPIFSGPNPTSSSTTLAIIWLSGFWNTIPARCLISQIFFSSVVSNPSTQRLPSVGSKIALICLARVDFPEPLCPNTAIKSPFFTSRLTLSRAVWIDSTLPSSSRLIYSCTKSFALMMPIIYLSTNVIYAVHPPAAYGQNCSGAVLHIIRLLLNWISLRNGYLQS